MPFCIISKMRRGGCVDGENDPHDTTAGGVLLSSCMRCGSRCSGERYPVSVCDYTNTTATCDMSAFTSSLPISAGV